ncbi:hypothetical protein BELL_0143g00090 [Botrytis elliptica]|uniref:Uncharacterized protein n=1 Tax=Botrytis elliptica TaxID=278938 RepID=A0A4Z1JSP6_9HELO|nr:hypothetical protein BELL_0143g00090 [Botrytis elliptica]
MLRATRDSEALSQVLATRGKSSKVEILKIVGVHLIRKPPHRLITPIAIGPRASRLFYRVPSIPGNRASTITVLFVDCAAVQRNYEMHYQAECHFQKCNETFDVNK